MDRPFLTRRRPHERPHALSIPRSTAFSRIVGSLVLAACAFAAHAEVTVTDAWVRGTVPAQRSTGAFATLTSTEDAKLVGAKSPAAKIVEVHEMAMHGGMAHMQAVDSVELPAGRAVRLQPGSYHVMLIGLVKPLLAGEKVPLSFEIEDAKGRRSTVEASAEVRPFGR